MSKALDFSGRVVLLCGRVDAVGRGLAAAFLEAGAEVALCCAQPPQEPLQAAGRSALFMVCDALDHDAIASCVDNVAHRYGRLDVLVTLPASAGAEPLPPEACLRLRLMAPLHFGRAANLVMQAQSGGGCIIHVVGTAPVQYSAGSAAHLAADTGLANLATSLAVEWAPQVRVNCVAADCTSCLRPAEASDLANACLFLASPLASYVSGARLGLGAIAGRPPAASRA